MKSLATIITEGLKENNQKAVLKQLEEIIQKCSPSSNPQYFDISGGINTYAWSTYPTKLGAKKVNMSDAGDGKNMIFVLKTKPEPWNPGGITIGFQMANPVKTKTVEKCNGIVLTANSLLITKGVRTAATGIRSKGSKVIPYDAPEEFMKQLGELIENNF